MIDYALSTLGERIDVNFVVSAWLPAFVAVLANLGFFTALVGPETVLMQLDNLDSFEETIVLVVVLVVISALAFILRALSLPVSAFFAGEALPPLVAEWSVGGQQRARARALAAHETPGPGTPVLPLPQQVQRLVQQRYPRDETALRPTRLGNVMATSTEYSWHVHGMEGQFWLPHLLPFLPTDVFDALNGAQARLLGLLNFCIVCALLAGEGVLVLGLAGQQWVAASVTAVVGVVGTWFCYEAALNQILEGARQVRAAFNLYRHEILNHLGLTIPDSIAAERELWQSLTRELLGQPAEAAPAVAAPAVATTAPAAAPTNGRAQTATSATGFEPRANLAMGKPGSR
jgi:hypothetical protein